MHYAALDFIHYLTDFLGLIKLNVRKRRGKPVLIPITYKTFSRINIFLFSSRRHATYICSKTKKLSITIY